MNNKNNLVAGKILITIFVFFCFYYHHFKDIGWFPVIDNFNLAIHEAGHPLFALIHDRLDVYGGTFLQLLMPLVFVRYFFIHEQFTAYTFSLIWFFENIFNVARYIQDARVTALPLAGHGDRLHDWNTILGRWDLLQYDVMIGNILIFISTISIIFIYLRFIKS